MTVEGGEKLCDESDVVMHYRMILGRDPESAAVIEAAKAPTADPVCAQWISVGEFQDNVVSKLANGRRTPSRAHICPADAGPDFLAHPASRTRPRYVDEPGFRAIVGRIYFDSSSPTSISGGSSRLCAIRTSCKNCLAGFSGSVLPRWKNPRDWSRRLPQRHRRDRDVSGDMVIVTGMHRSGTSLCASLISLLGVDISDEIEPTADNPSGHWERPELVQLHDRVLRTLGRSWHDPGHALALPPEWLSQQEVQALKDDIEGWLEARLDTSARPLGFKDPRVARLVALWDQICAELGLNPRYVFCVRHPAQVIRSMTRRDAISAQEAAYRWMVYNSDAIRSLGDRKVCIVPYEEWFGDRNAASASARIVYRSGRCDG